MADTFIQLAPDGSGKKLAGQSRAQAANTVYNPYWTDFDDRDTLGVYAVTSGAISWTASANTLDTGFFYLYNPTGSGVLAALRHINLRINRNASAVAATSPRLLLERFTYTGAPSGTVVNAARFDATFPAPSLVARSAGTGFTTTTAGVITSWFPGVSLTTTSSPMAANNLQDSDWAPTDLGQTILREGEGVALWQPDAGTGTTRIFQAEFRWEEYLEFA